MASRSSRVSPICFARACNSPADTGDFSRAAEIIIAAFGVSGTAARLWAAGCRNARCNPLNLTVPVGISDAHLTGWESGAAPFIFLISLAGAGYTDIWHNIMPYQSMPPLPFVAGYPPASPQLLGRFLPPMREGVAAHYVEQHTRPGDLVFDPFGQAPAVALESLALRRRVVVSGINPVTRLALSLAIRPPAAASLRSALTALADVRAGRASSQRVEVVVRNLYASICPECSGPITVDSFEWDGAKDEMLSKIYVCPRCGGPRESPVDAADRALAARFTRTGIDYHFLLDRVAAINDPDRAHAQEAMAAYHPRTLAAIGIVLVKLEALSPDPDTRRMIAGLLVGALDSTALLSQERPRNLTGTPRRYRELNFWLALEGAIGVLAGRPVEGETVALPELLSGRSVGIYAHAGSTRDLLASLPRAAARLLLTAVPRPNQAYWTLSALWSAWLWGREAAEPLRVLLRRRRYDWTWHARTLQRSLALVAPSLHPSGRMVACLPEAEPGFSAALIAAAHGAGYTLEGAVLQADTSEAQAVWTSRGYQRPAAPGQSTEADVKQSILASLTARAQPSRWVTLHVCAWQDVALAGGLTWNAEDPLGATNRAIDASLQDASSLARFGADTDSDASTGFWYLKHAGNVHAENNVPLADRVEASVYASLATGTGRDEYDVLSTLYTAYPGRLTPDRDLLMACLASYARRVDGTLWQLRAEDAPDARAAEVLFIQEQLRTLGETYGYHVQGGVVQEWRENHQTMYAFVIQSTGIISPHVFGANTPTRSRFLVLPGGRAGLLEYKLRHDPRLHEALAHGNWQIVKYRQVRRLLADKAMTRAGLEPALGADPLDASRQLALLI
jgi:hypothetical protein